MSDTDIDAITCAACGRATPLVDGLCGLCVRDSRPDKGAVDTYYRRPRRVGNEHHWLPIEIGGELRYQRAPPCHAPGSAPRTDSDDEHLIPREISEAEAERRLTQERMTGRLADALVSRTPKQRQALTLRAQGKSVAAVAGEMGVTINAAREILRRGRAGLRKARRA